jgi:hypothetical protein
MKHRFGGRVGDFQLFAVECGTQYLTPTFVVIDQLFYGSDNKVRSKLGRRP